MFRRILLLSLLVWANVTYAARFHVLVLAQRGGHHEAYSKAAFQWLAKEARDSMFSFQVIRNTDKINEKFLEQFQLIIQLDYPPYSWKPEAAKALEQYITEGRGGFIGFHHATLLGTFDGYPMWEWYHQFMGNIRWKDYIPDFANGMVHVEDTTHPVMRGVPLAFLVEKEEWYTYDRSPRLNVHVIASVDEHSYVPASEKVMGDHPVIWSNTHVKARNVYIFMGHSPELFKNKAYTDIFRNAISWAMIK